MTSPIQRLNNYLQSEEGKRSLDNYIKRMKKSKDRVNSWVERFENRQDRSLLIKKIIEKYNSDAYINRWYFRNQEPPEKLYWVLMSHAEVYGRECTPEEWEKYGNAFTSVLLFCNGYYFMRMDGQGSFIKVFAG